MTSSRGRSAAPFPERVGRYELVAPTGVGGMATVYLARTIGHAGFTREVAIKLMHPHLRGEEISSREFVEEAKLAARIRHPNVVSVTDVGEDETGVFLVMDYVEGLTLSSLIQQARKQGRRVPRELLLRVLVDALEGLHAAHELRGESGAPLNLVHRDFSPQNILIGTDGVSRLTDFGIAKSAERQAFTTTGVIKGKLAYMAPEQARGRPVDRRCDVWAAGVVAWELVTGERLFPPGDEMITLMRVTTEEPPRARSVHDDVPSRLDDAIAAALTSDVERRLPTADALKRLLLDSGVTIASTTEVADVVGALAAPILAERRAPRSKPIAEAQEPTIVTQTDATLEPPTKDAPSRWKRWAGVGIGVGVGGLALLASGPLIMRRVRPPISAASAPAVEPPPPSVSAAATRLMLYANAPIARVSVDEREVVLNPPSSSVTIELAGDEASREIKVTTVAVDGRRSVAIVHASKDPLAVVFAAPAAPSATPKAAPAPLPRAAKRPTVTAPTRPSTPPLLKDTIDDK